MVMDEPFIFPCAIARAGSFSSQAMLAMPGGGDPRRDDNMRRATFPYALWMEDEMFWRCLFLALAFLSLLAPPARAADKAWEDCGQTADQDRKFAGCTKVLARGAAESETNRQRLCQSGLCLQHGRLRPRHQGLRRGNPPGSEICGCLFQSRLRYHQPLNSGRTASHEICL